jgi:ABC-type spermidine/putrescine transport system permease subunit II
MAGQLYSAVAANSLNADLKTEFTEIADSLNAPSLPWLMTTVFGLNLLIPLIAIAFNNRLSAWVIFILGSLVTAFGTFHGLEHAMAGAIDALILALITLTIPGIYGCVLAYRLARSSRTGKTPQKEVQNV